MNYRKHRLPSLYSYIFTNTNRIRLFFVNFLLQPTWYEWLKTMDSLDFSLNKKRDALLEENISQKLYDSFTLDYQNLSENCNINRSSSNAISRTPRNYWRVITFHYQFHCHIQSNLFIPATTMRCEQREITLLSCNI